MRVRVLVLALIALLVTQGCTQVKTKVTPPGGKASPKTSASATGGKVETEVSPDTEAKTTITDAAGNNGLTRTKIAFQHQVGKSQCPQHIATITLDSQVSGSFEVRVSPPLKADPASGQLYTSGKTITINLFFDCSQRTSFTGQMTIEIKGETESTEVYDVEGAVG